MTAAMEPGQRAYLARWEGHTLGPRGASPAWQDLQPCAREIWARVEQACAVPARERVRHVKRGSEYEVLHRGVELQVATHKRLLDDWALALCEGDKVVVYQAADGTLWAREEIEFDGRFAPAGGRDQ